MSIRQFCTVLLAVCLVDLNLASVKAQAQGASAGLKSVQPVIWYQPQVTEVQENGLAAVLFEGRLNQGESIRVDLENIIVIKSANIERATQQQEEMRKSAPKVSMRVRDFKIEAYLPLGLLQIPFVIESSSQQKESVLIVAGISADAIQMNAKISNRPRPAAKPLVKPEGQEIQPYSLGIQLGVGFLSQKQISELITSEVNLKSTLLPKIGLNLQYESDSWLMGLAYSFAEGSKIDNLESYQILGSAPAQSAIELYYWHTVAESWEHWWIGAGGRQCSSPILVAQSPSNLRLETLKMSELRAIGAYRNKPFEAGFFYDYPLATSTSGPDISLSSPMLLSAYVSYFIEVKNDVNLGIRWTEEMHAMYYNVKASAQNSKDKGDFNYNETQLDLNLLIHF